MLTTLLESSEYFSQGTLLAFFGSNLKKHINEKLSSQQKFSPISKLCSKLAQFTHEKTMYCKKILSCAVKGKQTKQKGNAKEKEIHIFIIYLNNLTEITFNSETQISHQ